MVDLTFFEVAALVIPTLLIALGLAVARLDAPSGVLVRLRGAAGLWIAVVALVLVVVAELLALVTVAAGEATDGAFVVVLAAITLLLVALASVTVQPLVGPLAGTWLESVEVLIFVVVGAWGALALSILLLD
ncbi:hypothetical protein [Nocardioides coralli]|uniref:hypothetical protein n=1 Tax=Nocardioides coralli TaxID=2872154 RepID=UPI001CA46997|nr:hypothetical protein [Nocardioides coralli]QZY27878.1 hypothetical protein K6T13_10215 [Nocardioides coralli]